jgi:hypothetical protein
MENANNMKIEEITRKVFEICGLDYDTGFEKEKKQIEKLYLQAIAEGEKKERELCRELFITEVGQSKLADTDEQAGKIFDESHEYHLLDKAKVTGLVDLDDPLLKHGI